MGHLPHPPTLRPDVLTERLPLERRAVTTFCAVAINSFLSLAVDLLKHQVNFWR
jgi:hypothetical protein